MLDLLKSGTRSILITSGTLSPLEATQKSLGIPFPIVLQNQHVINNDQVFAAILQQGPGKVELKSNYENRSNPVYL